MKKSIFTLALVVGISLLGFSQTEGRIVGVGQAGDAYEQQADQVADKTTGMPLSAGTSGTTSDLSTNVPLGAGISGTTNKVYIVEKFDGSGICVTLPTNEFYELEQVVEVEVKGQIGGGVNADWITNTCAIRATSTAGEQGGWIENTCAIRMSSKHIGNWEEATRGN